MGKVSDITTTKDYDRSIAVGENRLVYVWGECFGQKIAIPTVTNFLNLYNIFDLKYELSYIIHNPLNDHSEESNILECLGAAFGDAVCLVFYLISVNSTCSFSYCKKC